MCSVASCDKSWNIRVGSDSSESHLWESTCLEESKCNVGVEAISAPRPVLAIFMCDATRDDHATT